MTNLNNKISKILIEFDTENQKTAFNKMQKIYEMKPYDIEINKICDNGNVCDDGVCKLRAGSDC